MLTTKNNSQNFLHSSSALDALNVDFNNNQLTDRIHGCLCKAEALAAVAATIDFETFTPEIINNYLWTLMEIVQEVRCLYQKNIINMKPTEE